MSSYTTVEISAPEVEQLPSPKRIRKLFANHTDYSFEQFDSGGDDDDLSVFDEPAPRDPVRSFGFHRKWTTDGMRGFAMALTRKFPGTTVEVREEWNAMDADEPGEDGFIASGGDITAELIITKRMMPTNGHAPVAGPEEIPWVVVEGGLVQYQSCDWGGPEVIVMDIDFLKEGEADEEYMIGVWENLKLVDAAVKAKEPDGWSPDFRRVSKMLREVIVDKETWPDGLADVPEQVYL